MPDPLAPDALQTLQTLADEATTPPWYVSHDESGSVVCFDGGEWGEQFIVSAFNYYGPTDDAANCAFIAAARSAVPELIARIRELEAANDPKSDVGPDLRKRSASSVKDAEPDADDWGPMGEAEARRISKTLRARPDYQQALRDADEHGLPDLIRELSINGQLTRDLAVARTEIEALRQGRVSKWDLDIAERERDEARELSAAQTSLAATQTVIDRVRELADEWEAGVAHYNSLPDYPRMEAVHQVESCTAELRAIVGRANDALGDDQQTTGN